MPTKLPQELKTSKVESLDGDLRSIAEQLIADKFGVKEEVVEKKSQASFPQCTCDPGFALRCVIHEPSSAPVRQGLDSYASWDVNRLARNREYIRTQDISFRGIRELLVWADRKNLPQGKRRFLIGAYEKQILMRDMDFMQYVRAYMREGQRMQIYGCDVEIIASRHSCLELVIDY